MSTEHHTSFTPHFLPNAGRWTGSGSGSGRSFCKTSNEALITIYETSKPLFNTTLSSFLICYVFFVILGWRRSVIVACCNDVNVDRVTCWYIILNSYRKVLRRPPLPPPPRFPSSSTTKSSSSTYYNNLSYSPFPFLSNLPPPPLPPPPRFSSSTTTTYLYIPYLPLPSPFFSNFLSPLPPSPPFPYSPSASPPGMQLHVPADVCTQGEATAGAGGGGRHVQRSSTAAWVQHCDHLGGAR